MPPLDVRRIATTVLRTVGQRIFQQCRIPGCEAHSLGLVCATCSRTICNRHGVITLPPSSEVKCVSCVVEEHRELWDEDENVIEAEIVD